MQISYKTYLRAIGRKPIPAYDKLRSTRSPSDLVLSPVKATLSPEVSAQ